MQARTEAWTLRQERINYPATSAMLTAWKRTDELGFLNEVSSVPLQQALRHLQVAFTNFFAKRARYPSFKSKKRSRRSAEYTTSAFRYRDGRLSLAKMAEPLDIVWSRPLPEGASPSTVTVTQDRAGRWFVSLLCDDVIEAVPAVNPAVGVDTGLDSLLTLSTGEKIVNPRHERADRSALARAQRHLARKEQGSENRVKARLVVARIHARIADRRRDLLHKLSTRLVRENDRDRGPDRTQHGHQPHPGLGDQRRGLAAVPHHARIQNGLAWPGPGRRGPLVPVVEVVLDVWCSR